MAEIFFHENLNAAKGIRIFSHTVLPEAPPFLPDWSYRKLITLDHTCTASLRQNIPVLIRLTDLNFDFSKAKPDGADIRFTDADGLTLLNFEKEFYGQTSPQFGPDICTGGSCSASIGDCTPAFDNLDNGGHWGTPSGVLPGAWIQYDLGAGNTKTARRLRLKPHHNVNGGFVKDFELYGSNTGAFSGEEILLLSDQHANNNAWEEYDFANLTAFRYHRIVVLTNWRPAFSDTAIEEIELLEITSGGGNEATYWVRIPSVNNVTDTSIYIYYGNPSALDGSNPTEVWKNADGSDFEAVWHLGEVPAGTPGEILDSTEHNHDGQGVGTLPVQVEALISKGLRGQGGNSYLSFPDSAGFYLNADFTLEWKMRWNGSVTNGSIMGQSQGGGSQPKWFINYGDINAGKIGFYEQSFGVTFTWSPQANTWYHCLLKRAGNDWKFFVNNIQIDATQINSGVVQNITTDFRLFNEGESWRWFTGDLDEVRITKGSARSDDYISIAYCSDSDNLLTFGAEEQNSGENFEGADNITLSDQIDLSLTRIVSSFESILLSDGINVELLEIIGMDTLTLSDDFLVSSAKSLDLADSISLSDNIDIQQALTAIEQDAVSLSEDIGLIRTVQREINKQDSIVLSEDISLGIQSQINEDIALADEIIADKFLSVDESNTVTLSDEVDVIRFVQKTVNENEFLTLSDQIVVSPSSEFIDESETIELLDQIVVSVLVETAKNASKILSVNPLVIVTDSSPMKVVKVDITNPASPTWEIFSFPSLSNAKDAVYNAIFDLIYVACADGKILQVDAGNFSNTQIVDTGDLNDLQHIVSLDGFHRLYAGTDDSQGEILYVDNADLGILNLDIQCLQQINGITDMDIRTIQGGILGTNIQCLGIESDRIGLDIRVISDPFNEIPLNPIKQTDFHVYVNGNEIDDVLLDAIKIYHAAGEQSTATFIVKRRHDELDTTVSGQTSQITSQNDVQIYIQGHLEFTGKVARIRTNSENETVEVTAQGSEKENENRIITISLSGINEKLHPYHCLVDNEDIYNPVIDPNAEDPEFFFGIEIDLGMRIIQNVSRWLALFDVSEDLIDGTFQPKQNWTYFWFCKATNYLTGVKQASTRYIGTSPSTITGDLWEIDFMNYRYQREFDDKETELGVYQVGTAPFKKLRVRNGCKITKSRWVDKNDGLYREKDTGYDFVEYAKTVAQLEYEKLQNINGGILPITSCDIEVMIDGYYYYGLKLLTRINIDNTTTPGIYKNNNGFPVAVKAIEIDSRSMRVSLKCDNQKSDQELQKIDDRFPDPESDEFNFPEESVREFTKFDFGRFESVQ